MRAQALGLDQVKLFPAELLGGVKMVAALADPFPRVRFMPRGGVTPTNARAYLDHPAVFAVSGSWMLAPQLVADGRLEALSAALTAAKALTTGDPS